MAIITAKKINEKEKIKLEIDKDICTEIKNYCAWVGISNIDHFFEEAANFVFSKDKDWNKYIKSINKETI